MSNQEDHTGPKTGLIVALIFGIGVAAVFVNQAQKGPSTKGTASVAASKSESGEYRSQPKDWVKPEPPPEPSWRTSSSMDKMTGETSHYASSPTTWPDSKMSFPYHDVSSWIGVGCKGRSTWAYFGFSEAPNLTNDETKSGYNLIRTRLRWDKRITTTELTQDWGDRFLSFQNDAAAIANLAGANTVTLELNWYGQQRPLFTYSLNGSSKAIAEIKAKCRGRDAD